MEAPPHGLRGCPGASRDVLFLIAHFLRHNTPCTEAADALQRELSSLGLLGALPCWSGATRTASYADMERNHAGLPYTHLLNVIAQGLQAPNSNPSNSTPAHSSSRSLIQLTQPQCFEKIKDAVTNYVTQVVELHTIERDVAKIVARLKFISNKIETGTKSIEPIINGGDVPQHATEISPEDLPVILKDYGLCREKTSLVHRLQSKESELVVIKADLQDSITQIRSMGAIHTCLHQHGSRSWSGVGSVVRRDYGGLGLGSQLRRDRSHQISQDGGCDEFGLRYKKLYAVHGHAMYPAYCVIFDVTGNYMITGADDHLIKIWDTRRGLLCRTLRGHTQPISYLAVSPDNSMLASASTDFSIVVWRLRDGYPLTTLVHEGAINWLKFDPLTGGLASAADDGKCTVWDLAVLAQEHLSTLPLLDIASVQRTHSSSQDIGCSSLFDWSAVDRPSLVLDHTHDSSQAQATGRSVTVKCVDYCPLGGLIVTGCDDAVSRVWRVGGGEIQTDTKDSSLSTPSRTLRHTNAPALTINSPDRSAAQMLGHHLVCRLQGHLSAVTDVKFSHAGERILTAAINDGTVRVWTFARDFVSQDHLVLQMSTGEQDLEDGANIFLDAMRPGARRAARQRKLEVTSVAWTCDDRWVVTLQFVPSTLQTRLKVWDSFNGALWKTIHTNDDRCLVLEMHPFNPRIAVTAAENGGVRVWDILSDNILMRDTLLNQDGTVSVAVDASFAPDGTRFAVSDFQGRAVMYGLDDPDLFKDVPMQQIFSTDYQGIIIVDGRAYTANTNVLVHECPMGDLINFNGATYTFAPPLLALRSVPVSDINSKRSEIFVAAHTLSKLMDDSYVYTSRAKARAGRAHSQTHNPSKGSHALGFGARIRTIRNTRHTITARAFLNMADVDSDSDSFSDDSREGAFYSDLRVSRRMPSSRRSVMRRQQNLRGRTTRNSQRAAQVEDLFQAYEPPRPRTRTVRSRRTSTRFQDDVRTALAISLEEAEELDAGSSEEANTDPNPNHTGSASSNASETAQAISNTEINHTTSLVQLPLRQTRRAKGIKSTLIQRVYERDWLTCVEPSEKEYVPQLGDSVMYFAQGHMETLRTFAESCVPPYQQFPHPWPVVECLVKGIEYSFPQEEYVKSQSIVCTLKLKLVAHPHDRQHSGLITDFVTLRSTRNRITDLEFEVKYRRTGLPDFMCPVYLYMAGVRVPWRDGLKFTSHFFEYEETPQGPRRSLKPYGGTIVSVDDVDGNLWPRSPWECLQVRYDGDPENAESTRLSPWEAEPYADEHSQTSMHTKTAPQLEASLRDRLLDRITDLLQDPRADSFRDQVDPKMYPDYYDLVMAPVDLTMIFQRLKNNYYRQQEAFEFDVSTLVSNCRTYNLDGSEIVASAEFIQAVLMSTISGEDIESHVAGDDASSEILEGAEETKDSVPNPGLASSSKEDRRPKRARFTLRDDDEAGQEEEGEEVPTSAETQEDLSLSIRIPRRNLKTAKHEEAESQEEDDNVVADRENEEKDHDPWTLIHGHEDEDYEEANEEDNDSNDSDVSEEVEHNSQPKKRPRTRRQNESSMMRRSSTRNAGRQADNHHSSGVRRSERARRANSAYAEEWHDEVQDEVETDESFGGRKSKRASKSKAAFIEDLDEEVPNEIEADHSSGVRRSERTKKKNLAYVEEFYDGRLEEIQEDHSSAVRKSGRSRKKNSMYGEEFGTHETDWDDVEAEEYLQQDGDFVTDLQGYQPRPSKRRRESSSPPGEVPEEKETHEHTHTHSATRRSTRTRSEVVNTTPEQAPQSSSRAQTSTRRAAKRPRVSRTRSSWEGSESDYSDAAAHNEDVPSDRVTRMAAEYSPKPVKPAQMLKMRMLLNRMKEVDTRNMFKKPITDDIAPGYSMIIHEPMDTETIHLNLNNHVYRHLKDMVTDFQLMFDNCMTYNPENSLEYKEADRQLKVMVDYLDTI